MKKHIAPLLILLVLCSLLLRVKTVESAPDDLETFYILSDGSVSPATPLIVRIGDLYSLAGNISAIIIVQKGGITFDGNGYTLYGNNTPYGAAISAFAINGVNNVTIMNTRIINYSYGVFLQNTMYNNITNNYFDYNTYAVRLYGNADFNTIANNTMTRGIWGVGADYSFNNNVTVIYNSITNLVSGVGINLLNSAGNIIQGNTMDHNNKGINLYDCTDSVISDNIMTYMDQAGIHLVDSYGNTIAGNKINRTQYAAGIVVSASSENTVSENDFWYNEEGIRVQSSSTLNTVFGNNLTYNDYGIVLYNHADNNTFYHNNFANNSAQVFFQSSDNLYSKWNSTTEGNYWSDYTGVDANRDGIGDTPYQINTENIDYHPLMTPFQRHPHEITLLNVSTSKVLTRMGKPVIIDVMVENTGEYPETFNVTVYAENIVIGTKLVSLNAQTIEKVSFLWQTGGFQSKNYVIRSMITGFSQEMQVINNGMSSVQPMTVMGDGCCILVAGSMPDDEIVGINNYGVNQVYKILRQVGYAGEDIYLMHQPRYNPEDVDGDGQNDVDANSTVANLRQAIESWALHRVSPTAPLFIYLLDHGGGFEFWINPDEVVRPHFMTNWITNLETATNASVHLIYAGCYSGTFINSLSKCGRIIVTSCNVSQYSYSYGPSYYERFSVPFWNSIKSGHSIMDAFNYACQRMASTTQTPLLDDNGDGVGHCGYLPNNGDGALAANTYIGHCEWPYPWISYAIAKQTFTWPPPSSVTLWAKIENKTNLAHVAVSMQPPDWSPPDPNGTLVVPNFERFEMTDPDHDGNWTVNIPSINFTSHASGASKFIFLITAEEENGDVATPEIIEVEFTASGSPSDDTEAPKVSVERPLEESVV